MHISVKLEEDKVPHCDWFVGDHVSTLVQCTNGSGNMDVWRLGSVRSASILTKDKV